MAGVGGELVRIQPSDYIFKPQSDPDLDEESAPKSATSRHVKW